MFPSDAQFLRKMHVFGDAAVRPLAPDNTKYLRRTKRQPSFEGGRVPMFGRIKCCSILQQEQSKRQEVILRQRFVLRDES